MPFFNPGQNTVIDTCTDGTMADGHNLAALMYWL